MCQMMDQFLIKFKTSIFRDCIIDIFDVFFEILFQFRCFHIVVSKKVGIHFDPVVPVQFANSHCNEIGPMSERAIQFGII